MRNGIGCTRNSQSEHDVKSAECVKESETGLLECSDPICYPQNQEDRALASQVLR